MEFDSNKVELIDDYTPEQIKEMENYFSPGGDGGTTYYYTKDGKIPDNLANTKWADRIGGLSFLDKLKLMYTFRNSVSPVKKGYWSDGFLAFPDYRALIGAHRGADRSGVGVGADVFAVAGGTVIKAENSKLKGISCNNRPWIRNSYTLLAFIRKDC